MVIVVGLTGSIASGKSTVADMFAKLGAHVIDYDVLAREAVRPQLPAWRGIVEEFGAEILNEDSTINREKLGEIVFRDPEKLAKLNSIVHPAIFEAGDQALERLRKSDPHGIVVEEVPLLIELHAQGSVDKVVVVCASEESQIARLAGRGLNPSEARRRIRAQMPLEDKIKVADFVVQNDGSLEETGRQVKAVYRSLRRLGH